MEMSFCQVNTQLGISSKTDDFHSPGTRYFRAHPALVQCYDEIMAFEKRWKSGLELLYLEDFCFHTSSNCGFSQSPPEITSFIYTLFYPLRRHMVVSLC